MVVVYGGRKKKSHRPHLRAAVGWGYGGDFGEWRQWDRGTTVVLGGVAPVENYSFSAAAL